MLQFEGNYPGWVHAAGGWRCTHTAERGQELLLFPACLIKKKSLLILSCKSAKGGKENSCG